ncbi:MAG: DUF1919 domain-containing protein [Cyanobacteria bacterium J06600_6]
MDRSHFLVSVIIPVYNGAEFLAQAVAHVLKQDYHPLEIVIVDDGSTDDTAKIARQLANKVRYFYQDNQGPAAARNFGIGQAKGNIIAFLDVDDLWSDNKLQLQLDCLKQHPEVDIIQGMIIKQLIMPDKFKQDNFQVAKISQPYHYILLGSCIYRKSLFTSVGLFDETMYLGDDVDWFVRAWEHRVRKHLIDDVTLFYRHHNNNITKGKNLIESGFVRVYKKHLDRKRQGKIAIKPIPQGFSSMAEYLGTDAIAGINAAKGNYTIIADDCWGGFTYQKFELIYQTPLVGTFITRRCYLKLLKRLRYYLDSPLQFTEKSQYSKINKSRSKQYYPIGLLANEIEIHFYHETDENKIKEAWQRRLKRINWDNLYIKFSDTNKNPQSDSLKYLAEFEHLNYGRKVCFTACKYPQFASTVHIPNLMEDGYLAFELSKNYFDIQAWLSNSKGNNAQNYLLPESVN